MPAQIPHRTHFLYKPIKWAHEVWNQIILRKGEIDNIQRLFNLFPIIEAYIEDSIGLQIARHLVDSTTNILQDDFVKIQVDEWKTGPIYREQPVSSATNVYGTDTTERFLLFKFLLSFTTVL